MFVADDDDDDEDEREKKSCDGLETT